MKLRIKNLINIYLHVIARSPDPIGTTKQSTRVPQVVSTCGVEDETSSTTRSLSGFAMTFLTFVFGFWILAASAAHAAAPTISYVDLTSLTDTSVIITWRTNTASNTKILYGVSGLTSSYTKSETDTRYHYLQLTGLTPNTTYFYQISSTNADGTTSSTPSIFTTLQTPAGTYLFSFATISDLQYADGRADSSSPRGRKYSSSEAILTGLVSDINAQSPAFTILKGDIAEANSPGYGDQVAAKIKPKLDTLTGDAISGFSKKYFAIPGNHDKANTYSGGGNWVSKNLGLLVTEESSVAPGTDSDFNYSFDYKGYHFILLDSVKATTPFGGHADTSWLTTNLDANSTKKTFIFLHHPAGDVTQTIPSEEVLGATISEWQIDNISAFQTVIKSHKTQIAGVFMGHVHDNNYFVSEEATGGVPFVRTASGIQSPNGYNIYKVYSGGYMQTFYKISNTELTEMARDQITSGEGQSADHWMQFWLGSTSARNFTRTYSIMPAFPPTVLKIVPASGSASIATNSQIIVEFSQAMDTASVQSAFSLSPAVTGAYSWNSANTIMTFTPSANYGSSTAYTVTIATSAKDASGTALATAYTSTFTTGSSSDTSAPVVSFDRMTNNITTNITPTITGTAEDALSSVVSVECRIDNGPWQSVAPLDGTFNSTTETFAFYITSPLSRGLHTLEARAANSCGITTSGTYDSYSFILTGTAPSFTIKINNTPVMNNDNISSTPSIEVSVLTASPLVASSVKFKIDGALVSGFTTTMITPTTYTIAYKVSSASPLSEGLHSITIEATDADGDTSTWEVNFLSVTTTLATEIKGNPLNFPNPFDPAAGTSISYSLTKDSNVQINIYDISSNLIASSSYAAGTSGGNAGYNEAAWDGKSGGGQVVGNGMYLYLIIADGKVVAKGKMMALK